jgi:repressor LexA
MDNKYQKQIVDFYKSNKRLPSYAEIMKLLGFKSKNAVYKLVNKLVDAGILSKDKNGKLAPSKIFGEISLLGSVTAGLLAVVEEELNDTINLDDFLTEGKGSTYMLEVDGDSMIEAHIADGDWVLVERTNVAKDKEIVIAEIDGEFTMKYFRQSGNKTWLEPANKKYKPIYPTEDLKIVAKVKAVIRKIGK